MFQERCVKRYLWESLLSADCGAVVIFLISRYPGGFSVDYSLFASAAAAFVCLWIYGCLSLHRLCRQIDRVGDVFDEILAESSLDAAQRSSKDIWRKRLVHPLEEGAVGRLESRVLESVSVLGHREISHAQEQKYLKEMMTDISHQIKTPLAALQVFLEIFERNLTEDKLHHMVLQAQEQVERIHWLVMGLLKLTQLESGMLPVEKTENDLEVMLRECAERVVCSFPDKKLNIRFQGPEACSFYCEKEWLTEAFQNLIKNCCEFSPQEGEILITWEKTQMALTVQIMDRGPGIPAEELPKIFNRFYQVRGAGEREHKGVGIGLSLAREIIERQDGTLVAYSSVEMPTYTRFESVFRLS